MFIKRRSLLTYFLVIVLSLCLATVAFAAEAPEEQYNAPIVNEGMFLASQAEENAQSGQVVNEEVQIGQAQYSEGAHIVQIGPVQFPVLGVETISLSADEDQMGVLLNKERVALGLKPLQIDPSLVKVARLKAQDMVDKRYFNHNSPTYGSPFDMLKKFGISYSYAGENLALAASVSSAHRALMESPGHRANILNGNYDRVGIGIVVSGGYRYVVQLFTGGQREVPLSGSNPVIVPQPSEAENGITGLSTEEALMVKLINQERTLLKLPELIPDEQLFKVARLKARDFVEKNYFGHTSPTYGTYREMLNKFGVQYTIAGENLAASYSVTRAHNSLMGSPGNKANILDSKYQRVGIGIAVKGTYVYYVQVYTDGVVSQPPSGGSPAPTPPPAEPVKPPVINPVPDNPGTEPVNPGIAGLTADEQRMLNLVNSERAKNGLSPLKPNLKLTEVARIKARDMIQNKYFSHTSPTYGSPFDMMRKFGISFRTAGENLAGAPTVDTAHKNLMNSPGHRANILNGSFKEVGIGVVDGGPYGKMFVQMFIG